MGLLCGVRDSIHRDPKSSGPAYDAFGFEAELSRAAFLTYICVWLVLRKCCVGSNGKLE